MRVLRADIAPMLDELAVCGESVDIDYGHLLRIRPQAHSDPGQGLREVDPVDTVDVD